MDNVKFCWFAPTSGDIKYPGSDQIIPTNIDQIIQIAKKTEKHGFDEILIPVCADCLDPFSIASHILANTKDLKVLIAYKPSMISPQVFGSMINTLDNGKGRVNFNIVQGDELEAKRQALHLSSKEDIQKHLIEWSKVLRTLYYSDDSVNFNGQHIQCTDAILVPKTIIPPKMFIGGGPFAMDLAAEHYDYYLTFADSIKTIKHYVNTTKELANKKYNRNIEIGMGVNIVARKSTAEALEACNELVSKASKRNIINARMYYSKNRAIGGRTIGDLESDNYIIEENLWAGLAKVRYGPVSTIYGSYEEVREKILQYIDSGISYFSLTGYPLSVEVERIGSEIISKLK